MKKRTLYISSAVLLLILWGLYYLSDFSLINLLPTPSLPARYKDYRNINEGVSSVNYQSALLLDSDSETRLGDNPPILDTVSGAVIVTKQTSTKKGDNEELSKTYLKLNADGVVIDSVTYNNNWPVEVGGYLITKNDYCSWILNGDKQMHTYIELNANLKEDSVSLMRRFDQLYQQASLVFHYSMYSMEAEADKVVFFHNGKWTALWGKHLTDLEQQYKMKAASQITYMANRANNQFIEKHNAFVYLDYFQKQHYRKGHGPSLGSPTGISRSSNWEGQAYLNLILKKDTLHIKQDITRDDDFVPASISAYNLPAQIYYFTNSHINFALFANDNYKLFIIKKRTDK